MKLIPLYKAGLTGNRMNNQYIDEMLNAGVELYVKNKVYQIKEEDFHRARGIYAKYLINKNDYVSLTQIKKEVGLKKSINKKDRSKIRQAGIKVIIVDSAYSVKKKDVKKARNVLLEHFPNKKIKTIKPNDYISEKRLFNVLEGGEFKVEIYPEFAEMIKKRMQKQKLSDVNNYITEQYRNVMDGIIEMNTRKEPLLYAKLIRHERILNACSIMIDKVCKT